MSRIIVNIDRLMMRGFESVDGDAVVQGIKSELSRIFSDPVRRSVWFRSQRTPVLRLGAMPLEAGVPGNRKFGIGIARAIGRGLKP